MKAAAKRKMDEHTATVRSEVEAEYAERLSVARARARKVQKAATVSESRLKRLRAAEDELADMKLGLEEQFEQQAAVDAEALSKIKSLHTWQPRRAAGRGGGRTFDLTYRRTIYAQYENNTPKSAIAANIISVVKATAPWLQPVPPSCPHILF